MHMEIVLHKLACKKHRKKHGNSYRTHEFEDFKSVSKRTKKIFSLFFFNLKK